MQNKNLHWFFFFFMKQSMDHFCDSPHETDIPEGSQMRPPAGNEFRTPDKFLSSYISCLQFNYHCLLNDCGAPAQSCSPGGTVFLPVLVAEGETSRDVFHTSFKPDIQFSKFLSMSQSFVFFSSFLPSYCS